MSDKGRTDLDKKVGTEPEDVEPWKHDGAQWRPDGISDDEKMPIKAMPFRERKAPFTIKGGGNGG